MTDLIARLEKLETLMAECAAEGHDNPNVPWCDNCTYLRDSREIALVEALPAILHALKVTEAAEAWEQSRQNVGYRASPEAERALGRAVIRARAAQALSRESLRRWLSTTKGRCDFPQSLYGRQGEGPVVPGLLSFVGDVLEPEESGQGDDGFG